MQNEQTENLLALQLGALLVSCATTMHVFASHAPQQHATVHEPYVAESHNTLEREREVHSAHGSGSVRARLATIAGT